MRGLRIEKAKLALENILNQMKNEGDKTVFNIATFSSGLSWFTGQFDGFIPVNDENIQSAINYVHTLSDGGSTHMLGSHKIHYYYGPVLHFNLFLSFFEIQYCYYTIKYHTIIIYISHII